MNITFKELSLKNFMSYEDAQLNLDRSGYVLVSGVNNNPDDNAKSNGTGKSSLFSAISWALTGLTVSGGKEVANINCEGTTEVSLTFVLDNSTYQIIRTKNPSNLKIFIDGENKSGKGIRDTEKILQQYLPDITHSLINSVIILGQGIPQKFTNNSPSGRKEVLEKLSNSDFMISDLKNRVQKRGTVLAENIRKFENNITDLNARSEVASERITYLYKQLDTLSEESLKEHETQIQLQTQRKEQASQECEIARIEYNNLETKLQEVRKRVADSMLKYEAERGELPLTDTTALNQKISELKGRKSALEREISELKNVQLYCPTCHQKLPDAHVIDTTEKETEVTKISEELSKLSQEYTDITNKNNQILQEFEFRKKEAQQQDNTFQLDLTAKLRKQREQIDHYEKVQYDCDLQIEQHNNYIQNFQATKDKLHKEIQEENNKISKFNDDITHCNLELNTLNTHKEINTKMSTILKRDFRGYLLGNVIDFIATQAKHYSYDIFGTDKLDFYLDGNNIAITYDKKDYEVLSGGEKQKVDVIIQLSIRDMLCKFLNFSSNILVLDEITDSLDITGCQRMFNLISTKLNDVQAVYLISHHQDFELPADSEISIMKGSDKISRIINQ